MADLNVYAADTPSVEAVVKQANYLLGEFNISTRIKGIEDISSSLFVVLFESLFIERLSGIIRSPTCKDDEIHNCQVVIDFLSSDIIHDNLSHIQAADIIAGDVTAIYNLLDIFTYLLQYVLNKIETDQPEEEDDDVISISSSNDDREYIPESPKKSKIKTLNEKSTTKKSPVSTSKKKPFKSSKLSLEKKSTANLNTNENRKVISHEEYLTSCQPFTNSIVRDKEPPLSPIHVDPSQSLQGQKTIDSTDWEYEALEKKLNAPIPTKIAWDFLDQVNVENTKSDHEKPPTAPLETAGDVDQTQSSNALSASMPLPQSKTNIVSGPLRSTVGPIQHQQDREPRTENAHNKYKDKKTSLRNSYEDLRHLVEKTAAMTRVALDKSPVRTWVEDDLPVVDEKPKSSISGEAARLAKELNHRSLQLLEQRQTSQPTKQVAFSASALAPELESEVLDVRIKGRDNQVTRDSVRLQSSASLDSISSANTFDRQHKKKRGVSSGGHFSRSPVKSSPKSKNKIMTHYIRNRQPELGAAHLTLKSENEVFKKKQEVLRRLYEEDYNDFAIQAQEEKDQGVLKEIEEKMLNQYAANAAQQIKNLKKPKGGLGAGKKFRSSKLTGTKTKKRSSPTVSKAVRSSSGLKLESEQDLMPVLLDEFPHLHLSEHTWHELTRKGIRQIESLTRAYQENKRKKSRAQAQMEDASDRHDLLTDIIKKQLEHSKRLRDIKESKVSQVQLRNKAHEKRLQSARARRYYNDYQVRARGKQLKRRTKEEMVFRDLFKDALDIQKERIKDIRQYANDQKKRQDTRRQNEIESLENYYHDQFKMLAERLTQEKLEASVRDTAQHQMLERMKRELRKKMESEIKQYQDQLFRDDDDAHFRQVDADKVKQQLHLARYASKI